MYINDPTTLTDLYVDNSCRHSKYTLLLNANFQDYMDSLQQGAQFQMRLSKLVQRVSALGGTIGTAAGALGGPGGMALGYTLGNGIGKFIGNSLGNRIYGQAMGDMNEIAQMSKQRHAQLASNLAYTDQIDGAIDTLRQNENKRLKEAVNGMSV